MIFEWALRDHGAKFIPSSQRLPKDHGAESILNGRRLPIQEFNFQIWILDKIASWFYRGEDSFMI